jgi:hypothetical protein
MDGEPVLLISFQAQQVKIMYVYIHVCVSTLHLWHVKVHRCEYITALVYASVQRPQ